MRICKINLKTVSECDCEHCEDRNIYEGECVNTCESCYEKDMAVEEIKPITTDSSFEDMSRYLENVRKYLTEDKPLEVRMPVDYYAQLTPDQIAWAESKYHCKLTPIKPIVFHSTATYHPSKEEIFKMSSPKEYGMSFMKRRKK